MKVAKHQGIEKGPLAPVSRLIAPFWPVQQLQQRIDRLFRHPMGAWPFGEWLSSHEPVLGEWLPAVNVYEEKNNVIVKAEIPGMKKDEFEVYMTADGLNIAGERKAESEEKTADTYRAERYFGRFHRIIPLPATVKATAIEARYKDGVLTVTCPKTEEAKRKKVDVQID